MSVFKSGDNKDEDIIKLVRSRTTVSGTVESIREEDGVILVSLGGNEYKVYSGYKTSRSDEIFLKDSGEFLLDAYGNIVSMKGYAAGVFTPAYMIQVKAYTDENTGEEVIRFKFLTESGVIYVIGTEKIKADGIRTEASEFVNLANSLQGQVNKVVLYKVNSKGNITVLDTVEQNTSADNDDKLSAGPSIAETTSLRYKASTKVFEGKFAIEDSTKVFLVPADTQNAADSEFSVRDATYFIADQSYKGMQTYRTDSGKIPVDYVVLQASTSVINNESDVAVVTGISRTINEDNEEVVSLDVYADGEDQSYITASADVSENLKYITKYARAGDTLVDFEAPKPKLGVGDLIKYSFNADGAIDCIAVIYSAASGKMHSVNPYHSDFHEKGQRYVMGTVDKKYEGYVELDVNGNTECHNIGSAEILEVDTSRKNILKEISQAQIREEKDGVAGDTLIIVTNAGSQIMTLLYR